jgi:hypothetical protein
VNRPYAAFAALAALLALSMLAVSSSSRSTTVQPATASAGRRAALQHAALIDTDEATPAGICEGSDDAGSEPFDDGFCPLHSYACDAHSTSCNLSPLCGGCRAGSRSLGSARVEAAVNTLRASSVPDMPCDGRSYHDPVYDQVVYGVAAQEYAQRRERSQQNTGDVPAIADDWLTIFRSLIATPQGAWLAPQTGGDECRGCSRWSIWNCAAAMAVQRRDAIGTALNSRSLSGLWGNVRVWTGRWTTWPVVAYRTVSHVLAQGDAVALTWSDRAEQIDRSVRIVSVTYSPAGISDELAGVQSSGWLRHSAAASLYRVGLLLQAAGRELEQKSDRGASAVISE